MSDWVTTVKMNTNGPPSEQIVDAMLEGLADFHVGGARVLANGLEVTCTVTDVADAGKATATVTAAIRRAARTVRGAKVDVEEVHTEAEAVRDRLLEYPYPRLIGVSEVAEITGMKKPRVSKLANMQHRANGFPRPELRLIAGPLWNLVDVLDWQEQHQP